MNYKECSIKNYLDHNGIHPVKERVDSGVYLSPLRTESTPSFSVNYRLNLWYDHGLGEGGNIIELVKRMEGCDFAKALEHLAGNGIASTWSKPESALPAPSPLTIDSVAVLTDCRLLSYLQSRKVDLDTAQTYCHQVSYTIRDKRYFAIGFHNNGGGWELRNKFFKGSSSPKAPTFIDKGSDVCIVFEGFMDMLSYLTIREVAKPKNNILVLNSVSNLKKAAPTLASHKRIIAFLDNDAAGRKAVETIRMLNIPVTDHSNYYKDYKDINEYLMHL